MYLEELQIGDWVYNTHHHFKVQWGRRDWFKKNSIDHHIIDEYVLGKDIEPVELTNEIFLANGFEDIESEYIEDVHRYVLSSIDNTWLISYSCYDKSHISMFKTTAELNIQNNTSSGKNRLHLLDVFYIHQLQQAMRMMGLRGLANSFKAL